MSFKWILMCLFSSCLTLILCQGVLAKSLLSTIKDKSSLQKGAMLYMNYCSGCHSLRYLRYNNMAEGLGLTGFDGRIDNELLKSNLLFTTAPISDPIRIALPPEDAKQWFGIVPPDLSLIVREKGAEWVYSYLSSFYKDDSRPFGTNNHLVPDVAMPNILETLSDDLSKDQFDSNLNDLIGFLAYVSEPEELIRYRLGVFVVGFLIVLFIFVLSLKDIYWRKLNTK